DYYCQVYDSSAVLF
nr:immunoglobulin light chain junction region [Macaca mulatta]MOV65794.1 immunoglobulin light chain junction region [Macaca mulatta]MOV65830.1 immunoglobulin light chain junction region [Macaca mulatta]MOV66075.1 immunoglobulin light chain junction region [Macaca mulatta]MOV66144.1 immunoglobulin light chain junction region [Macaca mulatta]